MCIRVNSVFYLTLTYLLISQVRSGELHILRRQIQQVLWEQFEQKIQLDVMKEQMTEVLSSNALLLERVEAIERGRGGGSNNGNLEENLQTTHNNLSMFTESIKEEMQTQKQQLLVLNGELDDTNGRLSKLDSVVFGVKKNTKSLQENVTELAKVVGDISENFRGSEYTYTPWTEWGSCSRGVQSRSRNCSSTKPGRGHCPLPLQETRPCEEVSCPGNYVRLEANGREFCLKFAEQMLGHEGAKEACRADGGHLVFIDTQEKQDVVVDFVRPLVQTSWPWIDGTRQGESWLNWKGEIMTYLPWNSGQPDSTYQQGIDLNTREGYLWHDDSGNHAYICEVDVE